MGLLNIEVIARGDLAEDYRSLRAGNTNNHRIGVRARGRPAAYWPPEAGAAALRHRPPKSSRVCRMMAQSLGSPIIRSAFTVRCAARNRVIRSLGYAPIPIINLIRR